MAQHRIIRMPDVLTRTGLSRTTVYEAIKRNAFPAPIPLTGRSIGWLEADIDGWLESRVALRRNGARA